MSELDDQIQNRRRKREALEDAGLPAFPHRFPLDLEPAAVHERYGERTAEELAAAGLTLRVPGRVRAIRKSKTAFVDLHDGRAKLQVMIRRDELPAASATVLENLDLGDYLGVEGPLIRSRTGELSIMATSLTMLAKSLRPLPEKWHGLADVEVRYRQRYLDLVVNPESRRVFEIRAAIVRGIRQFLEARGFLEVETPMMQSIAGGAAARPFKTHHNALDIDLYLRIAPELYLKRLVVGGLHRVYEINRNFRNEGISTQHNPEFTMLEFYGAYLDYRQLMDLTEAMLRELATVIHGAPTLRWKGEPLELAGSFERVTIREGITRWGGVPAELLERSEDLLAIFVERGIALPPARTYGHLLMALFEALAEPHLIQPTFVTDHPTDVSPLSKQRPDDLRFTERFREQLAAKAAGDAEAHAYDHDYVRALEHGLPPTGGEGVGIDRLTMLFADVPSIRDVILFPLLRPEVPAPV